MLRMERLSSAPSAAVRRSCFRSPIAARVCQSTYFAGLPSRSSRPRNQEKVWGWGRFWYGRSPNAWAEICRSSRLLERARQRSSICPWTPRATICMPPFDDKPLVLVVDDDDVFRNRLCRALVQRNWDASSASSGEEAVAIARERSPDLVLVDLRMPGMGGLDLIQQLRAIDSSMAIIVLTGYGSIPTTISAMKRGADHYMSKPADAEQVLAAYANLQSADERTTELAVEVPSLARVEWEHMQRVMADCGGNVSQAARLLGIHRRSLQRKLSKYPPAR